MGELDSPCGRVGRAGSRPFPLPFHPSHPRCARDEARAGIEVSGADAAEGCSGAHSQPFIEKVACLRNSET